MSNQETDRTKLTFSQAEGIDPLPQPADLGELPGEARTDLWNITYESFIGEPWEWGQEGGLLGSSWSNIQRAFFTSISRVAAFPPTQTVNPGVISPIRSTGL